MVSPYHCSALLLLFVVAGPMPVQAQIDAPQRPYRISDYLDQESLGDATFAPGGRGLAFTRWRPVSSQRHNALVIGQVLSDVWVQDAPGVRARNITQGQTDASGWWNPQWSEDGEHLAMLSSRGGEVTAWVWERSTQRVRQISTRGIDFDEDNGGCRWANARRLVCLAMPDGERSTPLGTRGSHIGKGVEQAEAAWARAKRGELSVSALNSMEFRFPEAQILSIDVPTGAERAVAKTRRNFYLTWWLSPSGDAVAVVKPGTETMYAYLLANMGVPTSVEIRKLDGQPLKLDRSLPRNILKTTLQWSPDGQELAFFALEDKLVNAEVLLGDLAHEIRYQGGSSQEYPGTLWRVNIKNGRVEQWNTGDIDLGQGSQPPEFQWTARGELLFNTPRLTNGMRSVGRSAPQWLVLGRGGRTRPLFKGSAMHAASDDGETLQSIAGGGVFVWLSDGEVRSVNASTGVVQNLTASFAPAVIRLKTMDDTLLAYTGEPRNEADKARLGYGAGITFAQLYLLEPSSRQAGKITPLSKPSPGAMLTALSRSPSSAGNAGYQAAWEVDDRTGSVLWRSSASDAAERVMAVNAFRRQISAPEMRLVEYTTLNGERMLAKLILPYGYQKGRRVPIIVDSDIGSTAAGSGAFDISADAPLNLYEMSGPAMGYAYLFASWPVASMDAAGRANMLLGPSGVIPAVDELIRQGVADPERVFLLGWSSMGYGAYGLVTQTSRFKAAVIGAGWVDQITYKLGIGMLERYSDNPFYRQGAPAAAYSKHALPFWRNADHLRRNSPLSYVDRVQTPLMIIKGDMDGAGNGLAEDEMFFAALMQQRKPAELVRYFGEGHNLQTPANIHDQYQRVFSWYDRYGDIARDADGKILYEEDGQVKSRHGAPPLEPQHFARFAFF